MLLLAVVVIAWGFSWYAIALQVGDVSPLVSIAWRFGLAGLTLLLWLLIRGRLALPPSCYRVRVALLGACLFCANFICFYHATRFIPSGLVSIVFAMATFFNVFNQWVWLKIKPDLRTVTGAFIGMCGITLVFAPVLLGESDSAAGSTVKGLALSILGTCFFSAGNLVSASITKHTHLPSVVAIAMLFGAFLCALTAIASGHNLYIPRDIIYLSALVYLAIGASVVAFIAYLTLIENEGAARASYATILFPLIALTVSSFAEGYNWTATAAIGVAIALSGACLVFHRPDKLE
ncbi:hypothetical protein AB833_31910 [Chromatiales bacterium (ex Bugula neritina AB1)]|nr:hypothetical protein AB833_31910 [Chromatiales bacterium (ex Bugula neritina AB1)]